MTINCYQQLAQALEKGAVVLATAIAIQGSVPREVGAKMIICADGRIYNTIGGGAGEAKVIRQAMIVLETGEKQLVEIDLTGAPQRQTQGICGGIMQIWLERWSGQEAIALVDRILDLLQSGQTATLVTPFTLDKLPYLLSENTLIATEEAFIETLQPPPTLLIVGAGHVGEQLAKVAHTIGFQVIIQDDRPQWANRERYSQATAIFNQAIASVVAQLATHTQLYAALVTRGFQYDLAALKVLLARNPECQYIGTIGSEKRVRQVIQALETEGMAANKLRSLYAPIGLDIGALTPEEIAVSICAELILVRRGGTGRPLSQRDRAI
ncbi:xanthine dehydrogenase [Chroococcidiopsis sp. CCALA 051]|uniref:XdhC family protein n=1 Tax=Chroococcidiopsis sp. CCALA 051 TaxID=869949 RepID=UPI000D0D837E|nr:XdhC/CoxI family protein [Chroococcidiopsis sp. CCALA 051]PSM47939.1 xanthine dehydrogenase [Chroococcidiopsis sp. CCALA 051]